MRTEPNRILPSNKVKKRESHTALKGESSEEEDFEEPPEQRAIPQFLMNLPGVSASDTMGYRIEALRVYLEQ